MSHILSMDPSSIAGYSQALKAFVITKAMLGSRAVPGAVGGLTDNTISFNQQTVTPGSTTSIKFTPAFNKHQKVEDMYLTFKINNSGAVDLVVPNIYDLISNVELLINGTKMLEYDEHAIKVLVGEHLARLRNPEQTQPKELIQWQTTDEDTGTTAAAAGSVQCELNLFVLFPFLENWITNSRQGIRDMGFEFTFRPSYGTIENAAFCRSSGVGNAYDPATITFTNISFRYVATVLVDGRLIATAPQAFFAHPHYDVIRKTGIDWSTPGNSLKVLLDSFPKRQLIDSLHVMIRPTGLQTAYNDADAGKWLGGTRYINFKMNKVGYSDATLDFSLHPHRLDQWIHRSQKMNFGEAFPLTVMAQADGMSYFFIRNAFKVDFKNIDVDTGKHTLIAGLDTFETGLNYEFEFICREAIHANCEVLIIMESRRFTTLDAHGMPTLIKPEKLIRV